MSHWQLLFRGTDSVLADNLIQKILDSTLKTPAILLLYLS